MDRLWGDFRAKKGQKYWLNIQYAAETLAITGLERSRYKLRQIMKGALSLLIVVNLR